VVAGAWGAGARELLIKASERVGSVVYQERELAISVSPTISTERFACWLLGRPEDHGTLLARFGGSQASALPEAFSRAWDELGQAACELLCGRFVAVTLDRERGCCVITRDQLGAQPLVYACVGDGVLFAEHERDLLRMLARTPAPDRLALLGWIQSGVIPRGRTLYEGIGRLPAGHCLRLHRDPPGAQRWWGARYEEVERGSAGELSAWLREEAFAAIKRASADAQRPAVKLSGGLDSACVAAGLAAGEQELGRQSPLALGGTFPGHLAADERELIEATASHLGLPLHLVAFAPGASMLAPAVAHIDRWRLPPASPNLFLWQPLTERASTLGVDVMLDGEGGDELFGLSPFLIADALAAGKLHRAWMLAGRVPRIGISPSMRARLRVLLRYGMRPLVPSFKLWPRGGSTVDVHAPGSLIAATDATMLAEAERADREDQGQGPIWWRRQVHSVIGLRDLLDMGGHFDREALDAGLELRHPLLFDLRLIEAALRVPPALQFDAIRDRPLLRDAMIGLIPEQVRTRHAKSHFSSLLAAGMRAEQARLIEPLRRCDAPIRAYVSQARLECELAIAPDARPLLSLGCLWGAAIANMWLLKGQ
jgi:asparagine synthase (glutamine-hydrolysing)